MGRTATGALALLELGGIEAVCSLAASGAAALWVEVVGLSPMAHNLSTQLCRGKRLNARFRDHEREFFNQAEARWPTAVRKGRNCAYFLSAGGGPLARLAMAFSASGRAGCCLGALSRNRSYSELASFGRFNGPA